MHQPFELLGLDQGDTATSFRLQAAPSLTTPFDFLYGGSGIAASVEAAERVTGRPLVWITTQFLTNATTGQTVDIDVDVAVAGRATSQVHVTARVEGALMLLSTCAHTSRPDDDVEQFHTMPSVPSPDECSAMVEPFELGGDRPPAFFDAMERRVAAGEIVFDDTRTPQRGLIAMWCRLRHELIGSAATLAYVADVVPLGVCVALGRPLGGTSIDNTVRMVRTDVETEWVLLEIVPDSFQRSIGHGTVRMWAESGELLAVAQQTCIIRTSHHQR
ncbi:MAG: acyl-CoA thioesterase-2 [Ilumatobacter sp.]